MLATLLISMAIAASGCGEGQTESVQRELEQAKTSIRSTADRVRTEAEIISDRIGSAVNPDHTIDITEFTCVCPFQGPEEQAPQGTVIAVAGIKVKNTGTAEFSISSDDFKLEDDNGIKYDSSEAAAAGMGNALTQSLAIKPGEEITRSVYYEVPPEAKIVYLVDRTAVTPVKIKIPQQ